MKNNVPWDVAFGLDELSRAAYCIIFGNFERPKDAQFDFDSWTFREPG